MINLVFYFLWSINACGAYPPAPIFRLYGFNVQPIRLGAPHIHSIFENHPKAPMDLETKSWDIYANKKNPNTEQARTLVLIGKGLVLEGSTPQNRGQTGSYIHTDISLTHSPQVKQFHRSFLSWQAFMKSSFEASGEPCMMLCLMELAKSTGSWPSALRPREKLNDLALLAIVKLTSFKQTYIQHKQHRMDISCQFV